MNPDHITPQRAKKLVLSICTVKPQRDEVYEVMSQSMIYVIPQIWVMRRSICGCFRFSCYSHAQLSNVKGRVKVKALVERTVRTVTPKAWGNMRAKDRVSFLGFLCTYRKSK